MAEITFSILSHLHTSVIFPSPCEPHKVQCRHKVSCCRTVKAGEWPAGEQPCRKRSADPGKHWAETGSGASLQKRGLPLCWTVPGGWGKWLFPLQYLWGQLGTAVATSGLPNTENTWANWSLGESWGSKRTMYTERLQDPGWVSLEKGHPAPRRRRMRRQTPGSTVVVDRGIPPAAGWALDRDLESWQSPHPTRSPTHSWTRLWATRLNFDVTSLLSRGLDSALQRSLPS